jgi:Protein of unknown function (DUF667)
MRLDDGWNQIQFNLADFTRRAYGTNYIETLRVQIHANCRIRRIYFSHKLYSDDDQYLPADFKIYMPNAKNQKQPVHAAGDSQVEANEEEGGADPNMENGGEDGGDPEAVYQDGSAEGNPDASNQ